MTTELGAAAGLRVVAGVVAAATWREGLVMLYPRPCIGDLGTQRLRSLLPVIDASPPKYFRPRNIGPVPIPALSISLCNYDGHDPRIQGMSVRGGTHYRLGRSSVLADGRVLPWRNNVMSLGGPVVRLGERHGSGVRATTTLVRATEIHP